MEISSPPEVCGLRSRASLWLVDRLFGASMSIGIEKAMGQASSKRIRRIAGTAVTGMRLLDEIFGSVASLSGRLL